MDVESDVIPCKHRFPTSGTVYICSWSKCVPQKMNSPINYIHGAATIYRKNGGNFGKSLKLSSTQGFGLSSVLAVVGDGGLCHGHYWMRSLCWSVYLLHPHLSRKIRAKSAGKMFLVEIPVSQSPYPGRRCMSKRSIHSFNCSHLHIPHTVYICNWNEFVPGFFKKI